jgi:NADH:ubiquinone oxidoreductase subunit H
MNIPLLLLSFITYLAALLGIAFYTLLERKILGYFQTRKGPNKVSIIGIPQPLADALKLFLKEQPKPILANISPFLIAPFISLLLAILL